MRNTLTVILLASLVSRVGFAFPAEEPFATATAIAVPEIPAALGPLVVSGAFALVYLVSRKKNPK